MSLKLPYDFSTRKLVMRFGPTEHGEGPRRGGGWRIFSSGPGGYVALVAQRAFGVRRRLGKRLIKRSLPASQKGLRLAGFPPTR